jgi:hypothetical protein
MVTRHTIFRGFTPGDSLENGKHIENSFTKHSEFFIHNENYNLQYSRLLRNSPGIAIRSFTLLTMFFLTDSVFQIKNLILDWLVH